MAKAPALLTLLLAAGVAAAACPACTPGVGEGEAAGGGDAAQTAAPTEVVASIEGDAASGARVAVAGHRRFSLAGALTAELAIGRRYSLALASAAEPLRDGLEVKTVLSYKRVLRLVGTLSDDVAAPDVMHLLGVHGRSYALTGETVAAYKEVRAALPAHDYAKTLFEANAIEGAPGARWQWLDYTPVARFGCAQGDAPAVHLDLIVVRPDESMLDGFVTTPLSGREVSYGAHVVCKRDGAAYACELDDMGSLSATARFVPSDAAPFDLVVEKKDGLKTPFRCEAISRDALAAKSED